MRLVRGRAELGQLPLPFAGEAHQRRALMVRIPGNLHDAVFEQQIQHPLHALARISQPSGNLRDRQVSRGGGAEHLPARLRLPDGSGDGLAGLRERLPLIRRCRPPAAGSDP